MRYKITNQGAKQVCICDELLEPGTALILSISGDIPADFRDFCEKQCCSIEEIREEKKDGHID